MIIKSKTRKDKGFRQLVEYIHKDGATTEQSFTYVHNMDVSPSDTEGIIQAFEANDRYRKHRKNGATKYHEYLSFSPKDTEAITKEPYILQDIAQKYISLRAPHALAIARQHYDREHIHLHFLFSGTERESSKVTRISKKEFQQVKEQICQYQKERYPQLTHSYIPGQKQEQKKERSQTHKERAKDTQKAMQKRGALQIIKADLRERIRAFLGIEKSGDFFHAVRSDGMEVYKRGGVETGVIHKNRKHRFVTLFKDHPQEQAQVKGFMAEQKQAVKKAKETERIQSYLQRQRVKRTQLTNSKDLER